MPRALWKGSISFGLVNVPVALYPAEKKAEELHFKLLDGRNKAPVHYERINELTGEEVPWSEIVKAYQDEDGDYIILEEEDFKRAAVEASQTVDIEDFVDRDAVDYVYFDKPYYLVPTRKGEKGYVLLRETLRRSGKIGIAKVVIRTRQYLAALIPEGDALVLELLRYHQELRAAEEFDLPTAALEQYKITSKELDMAAQLVETMSGDWVPAKYHDEYKEALKRYIDKKAKEGEVTAPAGAELEQAREGAEVIDITELLKRSVQQTAKERGSSKGKISTSRKRRTSAKEKAEA